jgi:hypothetical protein
VVSALPADSIILLEQEILQVVVEIYSIRVHQPPIMATTKTLLKPIVHIRQVIASVLISTNLVLKLATSI